MMQHYPTVTPGLRSAASCCHPFHEISVPRAARCGPFDNPASATLPATVRPMNFPLRRSY
jgi:hypothetical protein